MSDASCSVMREPVSVTLGGARPCALDEALDERPTRSPSGAMTTIESSSDTRMTDSSAVNTRPRISSATVADDVACCPRR